MGEAAADLGSLFQATLDTIRRRGSLYRWQVVAAVGVGAASLGAALALWSWRPLLGVLVLAPVSGVFFALDGRLVLRWQRRVLDAWQRGPLDLGALRQGLAMYPRLPARTLDGMLGTLPAAAPVDPDEPGDRVARAREATRRLRRQVRRALVGYAAVTLALASVATALALLAVWPLSGLAAAVLVRIGAGRLVAD